MSYNYFLCLAFFVGTTIQLQYQTSITYGSNTLLADMEWDIKPDIVTVGVFSGITNLGGSDFNATDTQGIFLAKYNQSFGHVWSQAFIGSGQSQHNIPSSFDVDDDNNIYLLAVWTSSLMSFGGDELMATGGGYQHILAKYDSNGNFLFNRNFSGSGTSPYDWGGVAVVPDGSIFVGVPFTGTKDLGGGAVDAGTAIMSSLAMYSNNGTFLWNRTYGDGGLVEKGISIVELAADSNGDCYAVGLISASMYLNGVYYPVNGDCDAFIMKHNSLGELVWFNQAQGDLDDTFYDVAVDSNNNVYAAGHCGSQITVSGQSFPCQGMHVVKFDSYGNFVWGKGTDGPSELGVEIGLDGTVLVTGPSGTSHTLVQYSSDGILLWKASVAISSSYVAKTSLIDTNNSRVIISGFADTSVGISGGPTYSLSSDAMYMASFAIPSLAPSLSPSATPSVTPTASPVVQNDIISSDLTRAQVGAIATVVIVFALSVFGGTAYLIWRRRRGGFVEQKDSEMPDRLG